MLELEFLLFQTMCSLNRQKLPSNDQLLLFETSSLDCILSWFAFLDAPFSFMWIGECHIIKWVSRKELDCMKARKKGLLWSYQATKNPELSTVWN